MQETFPFASLCDVLQKIVGFQSRGGLSLLEGESGHFETVSHKAMWFESYPSFNEVSVGKQVKKGYEKVEAHWLGWFC